MELNKNSAAEIKIIRKKRVLKKGAKSGDLNWIGKFSRIGSALPKSNLNSFRLTHTIKPPSQISANPILKAATKIDTQTASIPWEDLSKTLHNSKSNFARIKEIYRPIQLKKPGSSLGLIKKSLYSNNSNQNKTESRETRLEQSSSYNNFIINSKTSTPIGFNKPMDTETEDPDQMSLISLENLDWSRKLKLDKLFEQGKCYRTPNFHLVKLKRQSVTSFYESTKSSNSSLNTSFHKAPFSILLKGKKLRRVNKPSFFSQSVLTNNHFFNK